MSPVLFLDIFSALAVLAGFLAAIQMDRKQIGLPARLLIFIPLSLYMIVNLSNILENAGVTAALDAYEDYAEILFFPFTLLFIYAAWTHYELNLRRNAETTLSESRRVLFTLMENLPGMAYRCHCDKDYTMTFVSRGCLELTGYEPKDLTYSFKAAYGDLIVPEDRDRVWQGVREGVESNRPFRLQYRIRTASGDEKWVWEQGVGVFDLKGELLSLEGFITDVTERVHAEQDLARHQEHLETLVRERTVDLRATQTRLEASLAKLEEDEEAGKLIQFKLLPKRLSVIGRYEFNRRLLPSLFLSGDFVDCFEIDAHHLGFYIADVSGHGVSSAFVTVLLKSFFGNALENFQGRNDITILEPGVLLQKLNSELRRDDLGKHITIFYGVLQTTTNTLVFSNAGHFPFPILWHNGASEVLRSRSCPVGMFDASRYERVERRLPEEFVLLLFSDGILEVLPGEDLQAKLEVLKEQGKNRDFDLDTILENLGLDQEQSFPDDITFLSVRRRKSNGRRQDSIHHET